MKIKDLIKHLKTLDQDKELVIIATDPTDWDYGLVVRPNDIKLEEVFPCEENELWGRLENPNMDGDGEETETECYVIRMSV